MSPVRHITCWMAFALLLVTSASWAANAERAFLDGNDLLATGDMRGALKAYATALQEDRSNAEYVQQFMLVRRVLQLEETLSKETNTSQRIPICQSLRAFYVSQGVYSRALALDEEIFESLGTANAAIQLAETHLALEQKAAAVRVLGGLGSNDTNQATQALLAVALVRSGKLDEAREIAADTAETNAGPGTLYVLARMRAAVGQEQLALSTLKQCFEAVPPSRLDALKSHAQACVDFASLARTGGFAKTLKTESKVAESSCSSGSGCGSCPMRASCSGAQGH